MKPKSEPIIQGYLRECSRELLTVINSKRGQQEPALEEVLELLACEYRYLRPI
jgi:hypothetical protein